MTTLDIKDLVATVKAIEHHKGKFVKAVLTALEKKGDIDKETRKIVLDGFNNYNRAVLRCIGYDVED